MTGNIITSIKNLLPDNVHRRWEQFRQWQKSPATVKPISDKRHVCLNCSHKYVGSYCPRCGQPATVKRLDATTTMRGALDVWGMGSRSLPRAVLHLLFRPGYMIADYLHGHRQPYFPPFKMLFILTAIALLIDHILPETNAQAALNAPNVTIAQEVPGGSAPAIAPAQPDTISTTQAITIIKEPGDSLSTIDKDNNLTDKQKENLKKFETAVNSSVTDFSNLQTTLRKVNKPISLLLTQLMLTIGMYLFFRRSPRMGRLTFTEQFFSQVLITSQLQALSILYMLFTFSHDTGSDFTLPLGLIVIVAIIDFKQLYGFNWWQTLKRCALVGLLTIIINITFLTTGSIAYYFLKFQLGLLK